MQNNRIVLATPPVFSFDECLFYLNRGYDECLHRVENNTLTKAISSGDELALYRIAFENDALVVDILSENPSHEIKEKIKTHVIEWFDLGCDITPFYELLKKHPQTEYMAEKFYGLPFIGIPDLYEVMNWSIMGQLINLTFFYKIKRNFVERYGRYMDYEGIRYYVCPAPQTVIRLSVEELKSLQITTAKANCMIAVANLFIENQLSKDLLLRLDSFESRQKTLTSIKGIGVWTANYTLLKSLKEINCIPYGDAALLNAMIKNEIISQKDDITALDLFYNEFPDWKHYLTSYIWRSVAK
ncbi:MAG: hypothetical protein LBU37_09615 [Tannerellaceae bacterium]|nr:hypothetical protein [Tannerellaceae bacterium]